MSFGNLATKWTLKTVLCLQRSKFGGKQSIFHDDTVYVGHIGVVVGKNPTPKIFATIRLA